MKARSFFVAVCALFIGLSSATPAFAGNPTAVGSDSGPQTSVRHVSGKGSRPLGHLQLHARPGTAGPSSLDSPPGGGCRANWAWDYVAHYVDHTLASATVAYNTQVVCTATGPAQSMGALITTAELWKESTEVNEAPTQSCTNCLVSPVSGTVYVCDVGVACAGGYWVANLHVLGAPAGYVWSSVPSGCVGQGRPPYTLILCSTVSDVFTISPTY
ncbi:hypothetical protein KRMM14A1259_14800 [Krasilnikovia sp. MM14-A1259]